jgi:hypothetical protein
MRSSAGLSLNENGVESALDSYAALYLVCRTHLELPSFLMPQIQIISKSPGLFQLPPR